MFEVNDRVTIKDAQRKGKIIEKVKPRVMYENGKRIEIDQYKVQTNGHWALYIEDQLEHDCTFDKEFDLGLLDLNINIHLLHSRNKLHIVEDLYDRKFDYILKGE